MPRFSSLLGDSSNQHLQSALLLCAFVSTGCVEGSGTQADRLDGLDRGTGGSGTGGSSQVQPMPTDFTPASPNLPVTRQGTQLLLGGEEFRFAGANNYYVMYTSRFMVDDVLETAAEAGFNT